MGVREAGLGYDLLVMRPASSTSGAWIPVTSSCRQASEGAGATIPYSHFAHPTDHPPWYPPWCPGPRPRNNAPLKPHTSSRPAPPAGPKEMLDKTEFSQPALFVAGLAAVEVLRASGPEGERTVARCVVGRAGEMGEGSGQVGSSPLNSLSPPPLDALRCSSTAGLSLGEYSALVFAGAMSFEDGLQAWGGELTAGGNELQGWAAGTRVKCGGHRDEGKWDLRGATNFEHRRGRGEMR